VSHFFSSVLSRLQVLFRRSHFEGELNEELQSHLQRRIEDLERSGLTHDQAVRDARLQLGSLERYKEECREGAGAHFADVLLQDLRFAVRLLRKSPGFSAVAVLTLTLGIGANTALFSLIDAVLLRQLPYSHPERLVLLFESNLGRGVRQNGCSYPDVEALSQARSFSAVAGVTRHALVLTGAGEPSEVDTVVVMPQIFPLLGSSPLYGRYLVPDDGRPGAPAAAVISETLWRSRFDAATGLVGRTIVLDQKTFTVVGIMPASFRVPVFGERQQVWIPIAQDPLFGPWMSRRGGHWLRGIGLLKPNTSLDEAQAEAHAISSRLAQSFPADNSEWTIQVTPLQRALVEDVKRPLMILSGAVGLALLLACVNIANLMLARATVRTRELSIRSSLGAGRGRIVRQLMTEGTVLGLLGGGLGIGVAWLTLTAVPSLFPPDLPAMREVRVNVTVLGFALLLSLVATIAFGLAPAVLASRLDLQTSLREGSARSGSAGSSLRIRRFLAATEIALAAVLVVCAGLLARSLLQITSVDPGFRVEHVLKAEISLPRYRYSTPQQWRDFSNNLLARVQAVPELQNSSMAVPVPLGDGFINLAFSITGRPAVPQIPNSADYVSVSPSYFHVMGITLLRGRTFSSQDAARAPKVALISASFARLYLKGVDPIGQKLRFAFPPDRDTERTIVGVVSDVRDSGLTQEPSPMMYVPFEQAPFWGGDLVIRYTTSTAAITAAIHRIVRSIDPDLAISGVMTMQDVVATYVAQPKRRSLLLGGLSLVALLLAALGVFGVLSYSVANRIREFCVRVALGASPALIGRAVVREGLSIAIAGLVVGLAVAAGAVRLLRGILYGVAAFDAVTFFGSASVLLLLAVLSSYIPARRAMRVDPAIGLRSE
jgi:putative ABC transport system permease protein